jgi:hypothetical protein
MIIQEHRILVQSINHISIEFFLSNVHFDVHHQLEERVFRHLYMHEERVRS